ncbi:MAG TPA: tape measure protein [Candidatus Sphingomonas excrementigallinarum]|nr:tape measure protein [Candidatus Sphingomonas excrementigallinarum]
MAQRRLSLVLDLDTGRYSGRLTQAGSQLRQFGGTVDRTNRSVRQLSDGFDRVGSRMATPMQKLRDYVLILGNLRLALLNVRDLAVGWVANLVMQSAKVERLTVLMKGMSQQMTEAGKTAEAQRNLSELFDMARKTGFAMDDLTDAFVKFRSAKLDPRDGSLQALADSVAAFGGTSDVMHRASIAIQQMAGKGVISMEELRQQLGEAVPTAMSLMARAMGKSVAQLSKEVATGTVKAAPALALMFAEMQRTYTGAGAKLAQTMTGQLAELRTNVMQLSTEFTGLGNKQGLFASSTTSLKELNALLKSSDGKAMVASLGNAVNQVATALVGAVKVAVEFRDEIGAGIKAIAIGVAMLTAKRFGAWILGGAQEAIGAMRALSASFRQAGVEMQAYRAALSGNMSQPGAWAVIQNNQAAMQLQQLKARIEQERTLIGVTRQSQVASRQTITNLQQEQASYRQLIPQIQAQVRERQAQLRTAQTLHAANVAVGRDSVASAQAVAQAEANLTRETTLLTRTRVMLRQVTQQAAVAEGELAAAQNAEVLATERLTLAEAQNTLGKRAMATAATLATGATRLLQGAMALALNPVVMIGIALYQAASAAGVFETRADRAAAAADRLRQGLGSLADMEAAVERRRQIREEMKENRDTGLLGMPTVHKGDHWWDTGLNLRTNGQRADARAALAKEDADLAKTIAGARGPLAMQQANANWQSITERRTTVLNQAGVRYGQDMDRLQTALDRGDKSALAKMQARTAQFDRQKLAMDRGIYQVVLGDYNRAKAAGRPQHVLDALASRVTSAREQMQQSQSAIATAAQAMGDAAGNGSKGLDKFGRAAAMADAKVAGIEATLHGGGKALAEFNSKLGSGMFKGMSEDQIGSLRRAAVATDALKASRAAAGQEDKFESRLVSMAGRLAQLKDSLTDGGGELAKFNAQLAASPDKLGLTKQQIQTLRDLAQGIDETKHAQDIKKLTDDLAGDFEKAKVEGDDLWRSFARGTLDADERLARFKGRFAEKLIGLKGDELTNAQAQIDKIVASMERADAVQTVQGWKERAEEMRINLMDENAQREANFQRELQRQQTLLNAIRANAQMSAEEKKRAEENFLAWKAAAEARDKRANEMQLAAQARQWANLGQNIQGTMAQALGSIIEGMMDADANFGDLIQNVLKKIMTVILEAMVAYAILSAIGMANNSAGEHVSMGTFLKGQMRQGFSLGGSQSNSSTIGYGTGGAATVAKNHAGGMVGNMAMRATVPQSMFTNAQTRHNGGWIGGRQLKPGEVPLIGLDDEVILNKEQQKLLGKASFGGAGGMPSVQVNVINNSGTELETEHGEPEINGKDMIVNVVVEAAQKQGKLRDVFTQMAKGS